MHAKVISIRSQNYLKAEDSLGVLSKTNPTRPQEFALKKLMASVSYGVIAGVAGYLGIQFLPTLLNAPNLLMVAATGLIQLGFGAVTGAIGYLSIYSLGDGVSSLLDKHLDHQANGNTYFRNGGYTDKPSAADIKFGKLIFPIDESKELQLAHGETFLINNLFVNSTSLAKRYRGNNIPVELPFKLPGTHETYRATVNGVFDGKPVAAKFFTNDISDASDFKSYKKGDAIYILGSLKKDGTLSVKDFGEAVTR